MLAVLYLVLLEPLWTIQAFTYYVVIINRLRLGSFRRFHHIRKLIKQWRAVMWTRAGFWVTLEAKYRLIGQLDTLVSTIKQ